MDTHGAFVVLNTLPDDTDLAKSLRALSEDERFLVWSIDQPELSNFMMPALVQRGALRVAISTGGASPALAGTLRRNGEEIFDEEFEKFLDWLGALRKEVQDNEPSMEKRRERLKAAVEGFRLTGNVEYPAAWIAQKASSDS
jgi:precorrin-2 dehydrogenase/sirohydrochlorin ferrochelatase